MRSIYSGQQRWLSRHLLRLPATFASALMVLAAGGFAAPACSQTNPPAAPTAPSSAQPKPQPETQALLNKGKQAGDTDDFDAALRHYTAALEKARALSDKAGEAEALRQAGNVFLRLGQPPKAAEFFEQALPLFRQAGDKAGEAKVLNSIGVFYNTTGQPQKALEFYQQALPLFRQVGNKVGEANALNNIGIFYKTTGQPQKALEFFQQALPLHRQAGDKEGEARDLGNIGVVYDLTGQPQKALEFHQQALLLYRQVGNKASEANALNNIGAVYYATGQPQKSLEFYQQALPLHRQVGDKARTLGNIGNVYSFTGQPQKALEFYQQALSLHRQAGDKAGEAIVLTNIGVVYNTTGQPQKALEFYQQALSLHRQVGDKAGEANALNNIGIFYKTTGQPQKALEFFQQALSLHRQMGNKAGEANALNNIASVQEQRGRLALAERHLKDATALLERVRDELGGLSESKVSFLTSKMGVYHRYIHLLLKRNKPADAFAVAQKTKARALLDLMASGRVDIGRQMTGTEKQREVELRGRAAQLNAQMVKEGVQNEVGAKKRFAALKVRLAQAESDLQTFTDTLYARHPDLARKRAAKTATLADAAKFLPKDTALLEYVVLNTGGGKNAIDRTVLFVVMNEAGKATVRTYYLPVTREALAKKTDALRLACADPRKPYQSAAREMYRLLLPAAAAKQLTGKKRLVICPDGPLWDVPFAALHDGKRFLLQRQEIAYAYSATGAQAALVAKAASARRTRPTGTLLALANPLFDEGKRFGDSGGVPGERPITTPDRPLTTPDRPLPTPERPLTTPDRPFPAPDRDVLLPRAGRLVNLPGTQREADALKHDFPTAAVYTRQQAQETIVKQKAAGYRYLHLASHAFFNDAAPLLSSIVLANPPAGSTEDGFLTAREIFDLHLSADMVVLSACNTARGEKRSGEGIVGLTWALFVAGAPTQVLSQWAVNDASTATLMERFYAGVAKKAAKGASLRQAALALLADKKDRRHAHPYYWAPFILVGDWR